MDPVEAIAHRIATAVKRSGEPATSSLIRAYIRSIDAKAPEKPQEARKADELGPHPGPVRDRRLEPIQVKTVKRLKKYFQGLQTQALRELRKRQPAELGRSPEGLKFVNPTAGVKADPNDFWDRVQSAEDLVAILDDAIANSSEAAFMAAVQEYGLVQVKWDVSNPWLPAYLGQRVDRIRGIDQTTMDALLKALQDGYDDGEGMPELGKRVTDVFAEAIGNRSTVIARTETIQAYGAASLQAYREAGITRAKMYDGPNADSADCIDVAGQIVLLEEAAKLMREEHPNGTRGVAPHFELSDPVKPIQAFTETAASAPLPPPKSDLQIFIEYQQQRDEHMFSLFAKAITRPDPVQPDFKIDLPDPAPVTLNVHEGAFKVNVTTPNIEMAPTTVTIAEGAMKANVDARTSIEKGAIDARTTIAEGAMKSSIEKGAIDARTTIEKGAVDARTTIDKGAIEAPITVNVPEPDIEIEYNKGTGEAKRKK